MGHLMQIITFTQATSHLQIFLKLYFKSRILDTDIRYNN